MNSEVIVAHNSLPPYVYMNEDMEVQGLWVDYFDRISAKADIKPKYVFLPVGRMYKAEEIFNQPIILMSILRTPESESKFTWLAPTYKFIPRLYALKKNRLGKPNLASMLDYSIGVMRGSSNATIAKKLGFTNLEPSNTWPDVLRKLFDNRIQVVASDRQSLMYYIKNHGYDESEIEPVWEFSELEFQFYFAASKSLAPEVVEQIREATQSVRIPVLPH